MECVRPARLDWSTGTPYSTDFDDIYFSRAGGDAETSYVFLQQNSLPQRFLALSARQNFTIMETGFGTGLNWLATLDLWQKSGHTGNCDSACDNANDGSNNWLHFVSVEKYPFTPADLKAAQDCWPHYAAFAAALQKDYPALLPGFHRLVFPQWRSTLTLFFGDVIDFMPRLAATADAWFLDGFSPERNADMWTSALYDAMAAHSHAHTTLATFTAAGHVRRGLIAAGFNMEKVAGFGEKREMLRGTFTAAISSAKKEKPWLSRPHAKPHTRQACVIGAGIAGASTAHRLALRGWQVTVLESASKIADGASGNPAAILYPKAAPPGQALDHFPHQAWRFALHDFSNSGNDNSLWHGCGVMQLLAGNQHRAASGIPQNLLSADAASDIAGISIAHEAVWHAEAGWLDAAAYCRYLLSADGITVRTNTQVSRLEHCGEHQAPAWTLFDKENNLLHSCAVVIIANSVGAQDFEQTTQLPLLTVRGQISLCASSPLSAPLKTVLCHDGYLTPALPNGQHCLGATFYPDDSLTDIRMNEHEENRALLQKSLPELANSLSATENWQGRAALRCQSPDYLPLVGPLADYNVFQEAYAGLRDGKVQDYPALATLPGLYVNLAHGSKGFAQAGLAAEILASELNNEPAPVSEKILDALHPMRFWERQLRRRK